MPDTKRKKKAPAPGVLGICTHGLTDQVTMTVRTTVEDFRLRTKIQIISYKCEEHGRYGTFTAPGTL